MKKLDITRLPVWIDLDVHAIGGEDGTAYGQIRVQPRRAKRAHLATEQEQELMKRAPELATLLWKALTLNNSLPFINGEFRCLCLKSEIGQCPHAEGLKLLKELNVLPGPPEAPEFTHPRAVEMNKRHPHHKWQFEESIYLLKCSRCGMSDMTPYGPCRPTRRGQSGV